MCYIRIKRETDTPGRLIARHIKHISWKKAWRHKDESSLTCLAFIKDSSREPFHNSCLLPGSRELQDESFMKRMYEHVRQEGPFLFTSLGLTVNQQSGTSYKPNVGKELMDMVSLAFIHLIG